MVFFFLLFFSEKISRKEIFIESGAEDLVRIALDLVTQTKITMT